jgi:broad specificity phosphatase PhoE
VNLELRNAYEGELRAAKAGRPRGMQRPSWLVPILLLAGLPAQTLPEPELRQVAKSTLRYAVQLPPQWTADRWVPVVVALADMEGDEGARRTLARVGSPLPAAGFVVVSPVREPKADLRPLFAELRRTFRIEQGGLHALIGGGNGYYLATILACRHEFQTVSIAGLIGSGQEAVLKRLPWRRVQTAPQDAAELAAHFTALHAERTLPGAAGDVARVLDDFHDAAANGDARRYFAILPDDAVFLGTDGTERWTGAEFRQQMARYFQRGSAWTYVTLRRQVNLEPGEQVAWFDESFDNEAYGECRGSGVLARREGRWVLRQYHLTVPVPNDVTREVAARIRAFQDGLPPAVTTVVLVRHAEKVDDSTDAELSDAGRARAGALASALRDLQLAAVYTSEYRRTAATVAPLCAARSLTPIAVHAADAVDLAARIRREQPGKTVLVCGHSNTLPKVLKALGVDEATIADGEFDRLFVVTLGLDGPRLLSLRYASPAAGK